MVYGDGTVTQGTSTQAVSDAAHEVVQEAKDAGVWAVPGVDGVAWQV